MAETSIEWTHQDGTIGETWNPTTGCDKISKGCDNCYALTLAKRLKAMGSAKYQTDGHPVTSGPGFGLAVHEDALTIPLRWRKPRTVFVNSMSDLGHARIPRDFLTQVFAVMAATPQHTYQILTKRPERLARILGSFYAEVLNAVGRVSPTSVSWSRDVRGEVSIPWPPPNVWMGTSVEDADVLRRIDALRETPAAIRFVSAEPLLGPLDGINLDGIDWLIVGGESGPGARPLDLGWVRDLRDRCADAGTAFFCKQLGSVWARDTYVAGQPVYRDDHKGGDMRWWPADLRVREYPQSAEAVAA